MTTNASPSTRVELIGIYGNDLSHAQSAWTSTSRTLSPEKLGRIPKLLKKLAEGSDGNPHGTPFEKSAIHFLVKTDIPTHIQLLKHRIGVSINAESARYKEIKSDEYYIPPDLPEAWAEELRLRAFEGMEKYHLCLKQLVEDNGWDRGRAKEVARLFRPMNSLITADVMFNFRSFVHFQKLRNVPSAQKEIRDLAQAMLNLVRDTECFEHSLAAWGI